MLSKLLFSLVVCLLLRNVELNTTDKPMSTRAAFQTETTSNTSLTEEYFTTNPQNCQYAPGLHVGDRQHELRCCGLLQSRYEFAWSIFSRPLSRYLETLKSWDCPQFQDECERRLFVTTPFTSLLYDYFCNYTTFVNQCYETLNKTIGVVHERHNMLFIMNNASTEEVSSNSSFLTTEWRSLLFLINTSQLTIEELLQPCLQVAQYDMEDIHRGDFQELNSIEVPSCEQVWCGFSGDVLNEREISLWTCMSSSCHTKIIIIMAVCGIMAVIITIANVIVIIIMATEPKFKHSQSIYKIALAGADLLVGVIVLPTCICNLATLVWTRHVQEGLVDIQGYEKLNGSLTENVTSVSVRLLSGRFSAQFPASYRNSIGFFTSMTIFYSVYILAGAGFDRLLAVAQPLQYRRHEVKKIAKWVCGVAMVLAVLFSSFPFFINTLSYSLILSILITIAGQNGVYLYLAGFIIPFVLVWIANILLYKASRQLSKFRQDHTTEANRKTQERENRLARTLSIMIGVFTVNTLPMIILLICAIFVPGLLPQRPLRLNLEAFYYFLAFQYVATMLLLGNSLWNFFIYSFRNADFRNSVKQLFGNALEKIGFNTSWSSSVQKLYGKSTYDVTRASTRHNASKHGRNKQKRRLSSMATRPTTCGAVFNFENQKTSDTSEILHSASDPGKNAKPVSADKMECQSV